MINRVVDALRNAFLALAEVPALLIRPRFLGLFILPNLVFIGLDWVTDDATLIVVLNMTLMSLAVGVVLAYVPSAIAFTMEDRKPDSADYLTIGISSGFWGVVMITAYTALYRWYGMPNSMRNADIIAYARFMMIFAAVCHLVAPRALKESVPPKKWLMIGITASVGVFLALITMRWTNTDLLQEIPFGLGGLFDLPRTGRP